MADFVLLRKGKTVVGGAMHVVLDFVLPVAALATTVASGTPVIGLVLVLLSKWRMVAVRPRYWLLNLKSNLVDLTVGLGLVMLMYYGGLNVGAETLMVGVPGVEVTVAQLLWMGIYIVWLVWLKHKTSERMTEAQAIVACFVGLAAAGLMFANMDSVFAVVASFVIGYGAMRHVLVQSEDYDFTLVTFVVGVLLAELTFVMWHWMIILTYGWTNVRVPQVAVVGALLAFCGMKVYKAAVRHDGVIRVKNVWKTVVFSAILVVILLVWLSSPVKNLAR